MFAIESLSLANESYENSASVRKACEFLLGKQMEDGGWGESYKVNLTRLFRPCRRSDDLLNFVSRARLNATSTTSRARSSTPLGVRRAWLGFVLGVSR
jgi:hypothetical protein